jgi:hypothetical protein
MAIHRAIHRVHRQPWPSPRYRRPLTRSVAHLISRATSTVKNFFSYSPPGSQCWLGASSSIAFEILKLSINVQTVEPPHPSGGQGRVCVCVQIMAPIFVLILTEKRLNQFGKSRQPQGIKAIPSEYTCLKKIVTPSDHDLNKLRGSVKSTFAVT